MTKDEILRGIAAYAEEQKEILDAIDAHGGVLTEKEFDREFADFKVMVETLPNGRELRRPVRQRPVRILALEPHTFILGYPNQPPQWSMYLDLTQNMCAAGILKTSTENGLVCYRRVVQEKGGE